MLLCVLVLFSAVDSLFTARAHAYSYRYKMPASVYTLRSVLIMNRWMSRIVLHASALVLLCECLPDSGGT